MMRRCRRLLSSTWRRLHDGLMPRPTAGPASPRHATPHHHPPRDASTRPEVVSEQAFGRASFITSNWRRQAALSSASPASPSSRTPGRPPPPKAAASWSDDNKQCFGSAEAEREVRRVERWVGSYCTYHSIANRIGLACRWQCRLLSCWKSFINYVNLKRGRVITFFHFGKRWGKGLPGNRSHVIGGWALHMSEGVLLFAGVRLPDDFSDS